jgi:mono/diheme cytochrome c family protein
MHYVASKLRMPPSRWALLAIGMGFLVLASSCAGTQIPKDKITDPGEMLFNGQVASNIDCYRCHNGDATGTWRGDNLGERVPAMTDQAIARTINDGPGRMPAYKGKIDAAQIAQITAWLRGRFPGTNP